MTKTELESKVLSYFQKLGKVLDRGEYRSDAEVPVPYAVINRAYGSYIRFQRFIAKQFAAAPKAAPKAEVKDAK